MLFFMMTVLCCHAAVAAVDGVGMVAVDDNGDLSIAPLAWGAVLVQGVDVPASLAAIHGRLRALETGLQIAAGPMPSSPARPLATNQAPRVGQDPLGNLLLIPAPNRTLVLAGERVLELLTHAGQRLAAAEDRVWGPGAAPNMTSVPPSSTSPFSRPGTVGLGADGNVRIEPLAGKAVLAAGRDMVLELHRITARLNLTERALAACPCLTPSPATCRPCNSEGCHVPLSPSGISFLCRCNSGWQGPDCRENLDECALGTHSCQAANATCTDTSGSFACACSAGFTGDGVLACALVNNTGQLQWGRQFGSVAGDHMSRVTVDDQGRVIVAGQVTGAADNNTLAGGNDLFLIAYDGDRGTKLWSRQNGSASQEVVNDVAVDAAGNVWLTGWTNGPLDRQRLFGLSDIFLTRYDMNAGAWGWTRQLGTVKEEEGRCVVVDRSDPSVIYIGGRTEATSQGLGLPNATTAHGGFDDAFVAKYSTDGVLLWVRQFGTGGDDRCQDIAVFGSSVYAAGSTTGALTGVNAGLNDAFIVEISPSGDVAVLAQFGSPTDEVVNGIAVDRSGIFVTGWTSGSINNASYQGWTDIFVTRYTLGGVHVWTQMLGTPPPSARTDQGAYSVALDLFGNVLISGFTNGQLNGELYALHGDAFVAKFSSDGVLQWVRIFGPEGAQFAYSLAVDRRTNAIFVSGATSGNMFGGPSLGDSDLFVLKLL